MSAAKRAGYGRVRFIRHTDGSHEMIVEDTEAEQSEPQPISVFEQWKAENAR